MDAAADALGAGDRGCGRPRTPTPSRRWLALGGADLDARLGTVADDLGLTVDLDQTMASLSGGQAARVGLAALLLSRYDLYLLDEPTNDLDADGLDLLEEFVDRSEAPIVVVSHDREFLSRTVTAVVEIDRSLQKVSLYGGSYDSYLEERSVARRQAREAYEGYAARRDALNQRARMQRAWMEKGVRNARRKATDNDKHVKHFRGETSEKQAAKARQTDKMIARLEVVEEPRKEWQLQMTIASAGRSGAVVASLRGAVVTRGDFTLGPVTLQLDWLDRVAVTGPERVGQVDAARAAARAARARRAAPPTSAPASSSARSTRRARRSRGRSRWSPRSPARCPSWTTADVRTLLAKFGLGAHHVDRPAASQSPGERTRAALALLQARGVNLLVLDEPTNHLDLPAIEQLEAALDSFEGTILLVTHDRRMLETVRLTRRWHVEDGQVTEVEPDEG